MTYIEGFVLAVPADNKEAFREHAQQMAPIVREFGVTRMIECWGDEIPDGKINDFKGVVQAKDDEVVVFSWFEYPDKAARDAANARMMADPRMTDMGAPPFDGKRMVLGGFDAIVDEGTTGNLGYTDGFVLPVPNANREAYREMAARASAVFLDHGANRVVEGWGDDVPDGTVTDYRRGAHAQEGENVVFSWVEWPDKATRDAGMKKVMEDERLKPDHATLPFDGKRMVYGGFVPVINA